MLVFWKERLVFLAVPKTGTTALEGALAPRASFVLRDPPILKHTPFYRYKRFVEPFLALGTSDRLPPMMETIAVIRHPVDWLSSWYRYRHRDDLVGHANSTRGIGFNDFVTEFTKGKPAPFANIGSQAKFVADGDGNCGITYLFRYEEPQHLHDFLAKRLGVVMDLPRLNVSPRVDTPLSADVEELLRRKCAAEFAIWEKAGR
jgi:hypothetical protein